MITDKLLQAVAAIAAWLLSLAPAASAWPGGDIGAALIRLDALLQPPLAAMNYYLPVNLWMRLGNIVLAMEVALVLWQAIKFVISVIRGVSLS